MIGDALKLAAVRWLLAAALALGFAAGGVLGGWHGASKRAELASELAKCRGADADAAASALERQSETVTANMDRLAGLADQIEGTGRRFEQFRSEPREVVYRVECLSGDDDRRRLCNIAPAHPDCAGGLQRGAGPDPH